MYESWCYLNKKKINQTFLKYNLFFWSRYMSLDVRV